MFNSKIASLEARIEKLESRISRTAAFRPKETPFDPIGTRYPFENLVQIFRQLPKKAPQIYEIDMASGMIYGETENSVFEIEPTRQDPTLVNLSWNPINGLGRKQMLEVQSNSWELSRHFKELGI